MDGSSMFLPDAPDSPEIGPPCIELLDLSVEAPIVLPEAIYGKSAPEAVTGPIVHRLMENANPPKELDRVHDRDYLSRRFRAIGSGGGQDLWKGASEFERNLISTVDDDGALRRDRILKFLSCFGNDLSDDWALPLAILERSQKEDDEDAKRLAAALPVQTKAVSKKSNEKAKRGKRKRSEDEDDSDYSSDGAENEDEDEEEWGKTSDEDDLDSNSSSGEFSTANSRETQSIRLKAVAEMSPEVVKVQKPKAKTSRMELFVQQGGLKLLARWLRFTFISERQSDSLILPLLSLILKIPFDVEAIQQSRINKTILNIKRKMKKLLKGAPETSFGNNSCRDVFQAVDEIIREWKGKEKTTKKQRKQHYSAQVQSRINQVADKIIASRKPAPAEKGSTDPNTEHKLSVKELARIEREKEKGNNLTRDLEEIQKKRAEANRKLQEARARREPPKPEPPEPVPQIGTNRVKWKDGLKVDRPCRSSRELLESVRIFNKHQTAAGNDVPPDPTTTAVPVATVQRDIPTRDRHPSSEYNGRKPPSSGIHDHSWSGRWSPPVHQERATTEPSDAQNRHDFFAQKPTVPPRDTMVKNKSPSAENISSSFSMLDRPPPNFRSHGQTQSYSTGRGEGVTSSFASLDKPLAHGRAFHTSASSKLPPEATGDQSTFVMDARSLVMNADPFKRKGRKKKNKKNSKHWDRKY